MPLTARPIACAFAMSAKVCVGTTPNFCDRLTRHAGVLDAHPHKDLRFVLERHHFFKFEFVVHHEKPDAEFQRVADIGLALDGVRVEAFARLDARIASRCRFRRWCTRQTMHLPRQAV